MQDHIRRLYKEKGLDGLWHWAKDGKGIRERYHRWKALQRWAQGLRDNAHGDEREMWNHRRKVYRRQKRRALANMQPDPADNTDLNLSLGPPHWGGSSDVMYRLVYPVADAYHMPWEGDDKEPGHAVGGDHDPNVTNAFAEDFPTFSGAAFAAAVASKLAGHPISSWSGTYNFIYFTVDGVGFRAQILWAVSGHYDHVHVGIRRT